MNQNRVLSEIRGDDAVLIEKIAQLEKRLRKTTVRTVAIQTDLQSRHCENINTRQTNGSFKHPSPSFSPSSSYRHRNRVINLQPSFRYDSIFTLFPFNNVFLLDFLMTTW